jgi:hypothetical protein
MNDLERIAAKCLKPIEHQIYESDRQIVIRAIAGELQRARDTIVADENSLKPESLFDGNNADTYSPGDKLIIDGFECVITRVGEYFVDAEHRKLILKK